MDVPTKLLPACDAPKTQGDKVLHTSDLFLDNNLIVILHGRETYHLRLTRQKRLLLTKETAAPFCNSQPLQKA